jgi:endoglucanase
MFSLTKVPEAVKSDREWLNYLDSKKISWVNWNLSDKQESSSALKPGASKTGGWPLSDLTASGTFVTLPSPALYCTETPFSCVGLSCAGVSGPSFVESLLPRMFSGTFVRENIRGNKDSTKDGPETPAQDNPTQEKGVSVQYKSQSKFWPLFFALYQ